MLLNIRLNMSRVYSEGVSDSLPLPVTHYDGKWGLDYRVITIFQVRSLSHKVWANRTLRR